jgi:hypothetical protein
MTTETTEDKKNRVERVLEAHPFLRDSEVRLMLCHEYKRLHSDPTIRGPEDFQLRMELFVDVLTRLSEYEVRNKMAVVAEHMAMSWQEAIKEMTLPEDDD